MSINNNIDTAMKPLRDTINSIQKCIEPINAIQKKITFPAVQTNQHIQRIVSECTDIQKQTLQPLMDDIRNQLTEPFIKAFQPLIDYNISINDFFITLEVTAIPKSSADLMNAYIRNCTSSLDSLSGERESDGSHDYVTVSEVPVKEWDISEIIIIPIGKGRVRMKTADFLVVLSLLLGAMFNLITFAYDRLDAAASDRDSQYRLELEEERNNIENQENEIMVDFLSSIDASMSSQTEAIAELKESILSLHSVFVGLTESLPYPPVVHAPEDCVSPSQASVPAADSQMSDNTIEHLNTASEN